MPDNTIKQPAQKPVPHIPPDSAEYLEGDLPSYQSGGNWNVGGKDTNMNSLINPFEDDDNLGY